jgi:hypothetical protein
VWRESVCRVVRVRERTPRPSGGRGASEACRYGAGTCVGTHGQRVVPGYAGTGPGSAGRSARALNWRQRHRSRPCSRVSPSCISVRQGPCGFGRVGRYVRPLRPPKKMGSFARALFRCDARPMLNTSCGLQNRLGRAAPVIVLTECPTSHAFGRCA